MKKSLLFTLPLLFTAVLATAQVQLTTYRGAFAPAPEPMWTEGWVNWNPQATNYPATTVNVSGNISANTTWTSNNVYLLQGLVYIDSLVTLTIQPGTVIRGDFATDNSSLVVPRGAKLIAEGTQCNPIVFTSNRASGSRAVGDWGGVIMLGKARNNLGLNTIIEGMSAADYRNYHGGTDDNDNSGSLKFVRIEYGGFVFAPNSEINALTMGSIGRATKIDYIQTSFNNDDAFEWFGGTVNCSHLVSYRNLDDDFDCDYGFSGTVQFGLSVKDPAISDNPAVSTSEGWEADNDPNGTNVGLVPKTSAAFYNITQIGAFRCASNTAASGVAPTASGFRRGARLRRNVDLKIYNTILMGNRRGLFVDGALALANMDQDSLVFRNNIFAGDFTTNFVSASGNGVAAIAEDAATRSRLLNPVYANDSVNTCALLTNAWNFTAPDYRPNVAGAGSIVTDPTNLNAGVDLSPGVLISGNLFTSNQTRAVGLFILENGGGSTSGAITLTIPKLSGYTVTVPGLTLTSTNQSGTNGTNSEGDYTNGNWNFRDDGTNIIATSKPGIVIEKFGFVQLGFNITRPVATPNGTQQSLSITVGGGSDATPLNDNALQALGTN
jgi:hypothetical protein